ncbi:MAG: radical SAM protein [Desulfobacteraceae bacterium]|nr:radical SAM protein [Desulfobacteraceae bacterium]
MRVCLINPILFSFQRVRSRSLRNNIGMSFYPPLGLCYIANVLEKNGIDVKIIDRNALMTKNHCNQSIVDGITDSELRKFEADVVGITVTTPTFFDVKNNIIRAIRKAGGKITIVVGGPHASALPEDILQDNHDIDIVCRGEGELTMLEIAQGEKSENIPGISYRDGEKIISNRDRKPHDRIDDFCFPARHLVDMGFYGKPNPYVMHGLYLKSTTIFTSRGCPYDCTFCAGRVALGRTVRFQSPGVVIEEIDKIVTDYKIEGIYFADDVFDIDRDRAKSICQKLIDRKMHKNIRWNAQLRANSMDRDLLELMKQAGCVRVDVGFESGSQKTLDIINKKTTVAQNYRAARMLHEVGIQVHANIIVGIPGEDLEDLNKTKKFMREIKPQWIGFGEFVPLPGSKLFDELVDRGKVTKEEVETLGSFNFTKLDNKTFERFIRVIRAKIVVPTRIKNYTIHNRKKPAAYFYLLKLIIGYFIDKCRAIPKLY